MKTKTNIFFHAPKELTTDAFLVWLIYFLDSDKEYMVYKQTFFDSLILKKEDCGRAIGPVELKRQEKKRPLMELLVPIYMNNNWYWGTVYLDHYRNAKTILVAKTQQDTEIVKCRKSFSQNEFYDLYDADDKAIIVFHGRS